MTAVYMTDNISIAQDIALAFDINISKQNEFGFYEKRDSAVRIVVTYSNGQCFEVKEPEDFDIKYKNLNINNLPFIYPHSAAKVIKVIENKAALFAKIARTLREADFIVIAGNAEREGELTQRWIIEKAGIKGRIPIYRLWIRTLTRESIKKAADNLIAADILPSIDMNDIRKREAEIFLNMYHAEEARAIINVFLKINYSRAISLMRADGTAVVYDRYQAPIVNAIVERDKEIERFISKPYWYLTGAFKKEGYIFEGVLLREINETYTFDTRSKAESVFNSLKTKASVKRKIVKNKRQNPPKPYDLLALQKEMAEKYDFDAGYTLGICQKLYAEYKVLSYPKTDNRYFTSDIKEELNQSLNSLNFGKFSEKINLCEKSEVPDKYFNDTKIGEHSALYFTEEQIPLSKVYYALNDDEKRVFDEIAYNYIALFLPPFEYKVITLILESGEYLFRATSRKIARFGYMDIYSEHQLDKPDLSEYEEGDIIEFNAEIKEEGSKPKNRYTIASLLELMRVYNIGTGGIRETILKEIITAKEGNKTSYIMKKGKYFYSTKFGRQINEIIPEKLRSLEFISKIDLCLRNIEVGRLDKINFLKEIEKTVKEDINKMKIEEHSKLTVNKTAENFKCPICGKPLKDRGLFYGCCGYLDGNNCTFTISKEFRKSELTKKELNSLLTKGKVRKEGFISKTGIKYGGIITLKIENGKTKMGFTFE